MKYPLISNKGLLTRAHGRPCPNPTHISVQDHRFTGGQNNAGPIWITAACPNYLPICRPELIVESVGGVLLVDSRKRNENKKKGKKMKNETKRKEG